MSLRSDRPGVNLPRRDQDQINALGRAWVRVSRDLISHRRAAIRWIGVAFSSGIGLGVALGLGVLSIELPTEPPPPREDCGYPLCGSWYPTGNHCTEGGLPGCEWERYCQDDCGPFYQQTCIASGGANCPTAIGSNPPVEVIRERLQDSEVRDWLNGQGLHVEGGVIFTKSGRMLDFNVDLSAPVRRVTPSD